ncbi:MAG: methyl-accepting chemotaxis protein, partial [Pseudomonadota bacterium]
EQAIGIEQINSAVRNLDQVTKRNEDAAGSGLQKAAEIQGQADELASAVRGFRLSQAAPEADDSQGAEPIAKAA